MPKVSVIIPSYNYAHYLEQCLRSICAQTFHDWEAIIVDDGSTDNTEAISKPLLALAPGKIHYYRTENKGVTHARNFAAEKSSGDYILPLDADDILVPDALENFVGTLEQSPEAGFAYCAVMNFGERPEDNTIWQPGEYNLDRLRWENLAACTSLWRRELFLDGVRYRDVIFEDWDLWLQIAAKGYNGKYINKALFGYRIHHTGRNTINKNRYLQSLIEEINLNRSLYNDQLFAWSINSMANYPSCLSLPTIAFLTKPGTPQFSQFAGELMDLATEYLKLGHFVVGLGDYRQQQQMLPGMVFLSYKKAFSIDEAKEEIYKIGKEVIVLSELGEEANQQLLTVNNVKLVTAPAGPGTILSDRKTSAHQHPRITITKDLPSISVVTVSYNQAEFIRENIESVLAQKYPKVEHLIIDGGSNDGTVDILKSYPHLKWISERDRGQTHALNKGFNMASGDIIAWLNSDDWYPENVFFDVAEGLKDHSVLLGACEVKDREGNVKELIENVPRNWHDILKYWIFYSCPAQPSIFFKRHILDEFRLEDGNVLDEGLDFCMDYEFWLRVAKRYPFTNTTKKVLSYFRTYESNKTGRDMDSVYREVSRVFSRYARQESERALTFLIPVTRIDQQFFTTIDSLVKQNLLDYEILVVDHSADEKAAREMRREVIDLEKKYPYINVRYLRSLNTNQIAAINQAFQAARGEYIALLAAGSVVNAEFCFETKNLFRHDIVGMALPGSGNDAFNALISTSDQGNRQLHLERIFDSPWIAPLFVARRLAWQDIGGAKDADTDHFLLKDLILQLMHRGWRVSVDNNLSLSVPQIAEEAEKNQKVAEQSGVFAARAITQIHELIDLDEFTQLRVKHGFALVFNPEIAERSKKLIAEITKSGPIRL